MTSAQYDGAVAIVTGAASGIGRALARALARRGCQVVLADLDLEDAQAVAADIVAQGGRAEAHRLDVAQFAEVDALVARTAEQFGRIDYLFNNAGIGVTGAVHEYTLASWQRIIGVNLGGVVNGVHAVYPRMIAQGFGHIVNTASIAGLTTGAAMTSYTTTKHAVVGLSKALRIEAAVHGVRVSVVCPGVIRTPILEGGKHGIFLLPMPETAQRALTAKLFELFRPMDPAVFARQLLDQVARNRGLIVIPGWYKGLWWLERFCPPLAELFARKGYQHYLAARAQAAAE